MKSKTFLYLYLGLVISYLGLVLGLPFDPALLSQYNVTESTARLIQVSFAMPGILIWLTSLYGFLRFRKYGLVIKKEKEGPAFSKLVSGLMVLSFSLPLNAMLGSLLDFITFKNPGFASASIITRNYATLGYQFAAFGLIALGALGLRNTLKTRLDKSSQKFTIFIIIFTSLFTWLITASPLNQNTEKLYHLPDWLVLVTIVIPYLITWYMGAVAVKNLVTYQHYVKGIVYKQAILNLVWGIGLIVGLSISIQGIITLLDDVNANNLGSVVLLIYGFLALYAVGFGLVAKGARRLQRLEEV